MGIVWVVLWYDVAGQCRVYMLWVQIEAAMQMHNVTQCNTGECRHKPPGLLCAWFFINFCLPHVQNPLINTFSTIPIFSSMTPHGMLQSQCEKSWRSDEYFDITHGEAGFGVCPAPFRLALVQCSSLCSSPPFWLVMYNLCCFMLEVQDCAFVLISQWVIVKRLPWVY